MPTLLQSSQPSDGVTHALDRIRRQALARTQGSCGLRAAALRYGWRTSRAWHRRVRSQSGPDLVTVNGHCRARCFPAPLGAANIVGQGPAGAALTHLANIAICHRGATAALCLRMDEIRATYQGQNNGERSWFSNSSSPGSLLLANSPATHLHCAYHEVAWSGYLGRLALPTCNGDTPEHTPSLSQGRGPEGRLRSGVGAPLPDRRAYGFSRLPGALYTPRWVHEDARSHHLAALRRLRRSASPRPGILQRGLDLRLPGFGSLTRSSHQSAGLRTLPVRL